MNQGTIELFSDEALYPLFTQVGRDKCPIKQIEILDEAEAAFDASDEIYALLGLATRATNAINLDTTLTS